MSDENPALFRRTAEYLLWRSSSRRSPWLSRGPYRSCSVRMRCSAKQTFSTGKLVILLSCSVFCPKPDADSDKGYPPSLRDLTDRRNNMVHLIKFPAWSLLSDLRPCDSFALFDRKWRISYVHRGLLLQTHLLMTPVMRSRSMRSTSALFQKCRRS